MAVTLLNYSIPESQITGQFFQQLGSDVTAQFGTQRYFRFKMVVTIPDEADRRGVRGRIQSWIEAKVGGTVPPPNNYFLVGELPIVRSYVDSNGALEVWGGQAGVGVQTITHELIVSRSFYNTGETTSAGGYLPVLPLATGPMIAGALFDSPGQPVGFGAFDITMRANIRGLLRASATGALPITVVITEEQIS